MRRPLLLAAALSSAVAVGFGSTPAKADMFNINAAAPGTLTFSGSGTAQFNNSIGTNNSFQVGSATSLGVNASTSSTPEYGVSSVATLDLDGSSTMNQVIGTSGANQTRTSEATAAHSVARDAMYERGWGASYDVNNSRGYTSEGEWSAGYSAAYSAEYENAYSNIRSNSTDTSSDGTISGSFKTVEYGRSSASGSASDWESSASASADSKWGVSYDPNTATAGSPSRNGKPLGIASTTRLIPAHLPEPASTPTAT